MSDTETPLDKRCREAHPKYITVGNVTHERNDISAAKYGVSEKTLDRKGGPLFKFGNVKYRPQPEHDQFMLTACRIRRPEPPSAKRRRVR